MDKVLSYLLSVMSAFIKCFSWRGEVVTYLICYVCSFSFFLLIISLSLCLHPTSCPSSFSACLYLHPIPVSRIPLYNLFSSAWFQSLNSYMFIWCMGASKKSKTSKDVCILCRRFCNHLELKLTHIIISPSIRKLILPSIKCKMLFLYLGRSFTYGMKISESHVCFSWWMTLILQKIL